MDTNYIAFISYRHLPLDIAVAEQLHRMLERYVIPKEYRRTPEEKHLGTVFRDRDELPLSSNLTQDIYDALDNSQFLIVICTPDTPKSAWVRREIEYFVSKHGHDRVLTVLAAGTPEESIPREILEVRAPDGSVLQEIEPLCAFLVDETREKILKNLKKEFLRLIAAILGCPYDALVQRAKRYRMQQFAAALAVALAVLLAFMLMLWNRNREISRKNEEISQKNEQIQEHLTQAKINETAALSMLSQSQLAQGDRRAALDSAVKALPSPEDDRPYSPAAEYALTSALHPYGNGDMEFDTVIRQPTEILVFDLSDDGKYVVTVDAYGTLHCFETGSGLLLWSQPVEPEDYAPNILLEILDSKGTVLYQTDQDGFKGSIFSLESGACLHDYSHPGNIVSITVPSALSDGENYLMEYYSGYITQQERREAYCQIYDVSTMEFFGWVSAYTELYQAKPCISEQHMKIAVPLYDFEPAQLEIMVYDLENWTCDFFVAVPVDVNGSISTDDILVDYLEDGTLLVYVYSWDSDSNQAYSNAFWYAPDGSLLDAMYEALPLDSSSFYLEGSCITDTHALYIHDRHVVSVNLETRELEYSTGLSASVAGYYLNRSNGLVVLLTDGTVQEWCNSRHWQKKGTYIDSPYSISSAMGTDAPREVCCLVPYNDPAALRVVRGMEAEPLLRLEQPLIAADSEDLSDLEVYPSPGGNYLAAVEDNSLGDTANLFTVYETATGRIVDQFQHTGYIRDLFFSGDEQRILFSGHIYDLTEHTLTRFENGDAVLPASISSRNYTGAPYLQPGAQSGMTAYLDEKNGALQLWDGTGNHRAVPLPEGELLFHSNTSIFDYSDMLEIGGSGLVAISNLEIPELAIGYVSSDTTAEFLIYSIEENRWTRLPNTVSAKGIPAVAVGNLEPVVAIAGYDQILRIYDQPRDAVIKEFPLPVPADAVTGMRFLMEDQLLVLEQKSPYTATFVDMEDGTVLGQFHLDYLWSDSLYQIDERSSRLYISVFDGTQNGLCIDLDTWTAVAEIPGLLCILPGTQSFVQMDYLNTSLSIKPLRDLDALLEESRQVLSGTTP